MNVFDSALTNGRIIEQGHRVLGYLNPFAPGELQICDESGRWLGTAERVQRICKLDTEALRHRYGQVRSIETKLLAPVARRGAALIRDRIEMHKHNSNLLEGKPITPDEKAAARLDRSAARFGAALTTAIPEEPPESEFVGPVEDWTDTTSTPETAAASPVTAQPNDPESW